MSTSVTAPGETLVAMGRPLDEPCCVNADCADSGRFDAGNR